MGNFYVYWKPVSPPVTINYVVKVHCLNLPPCSFTKTVNNGNVIKMNGGYLGVKIPALPNLNSQVELSIFPPGCPTQYTVAFLFTMDIITDVLDISTASCNDDTCMMKLTSWKTLTELTDYYNSKCGGAGAAVGASSVTTVDSDIEIKLRKNANGKWQIKTVDSVKCDSCYAFNFQITCPNGNIYFVQDTICFNYTGPNIGCRESDEEINKPLVALYPNPSSTSCKMEMMIEKPSVITVSLVSTLGERIGVLNDQAILYEGIYEIDLPISDLTPGIYVVEVRINNSLVRKSC
jgi:hypothetical protein